MEVAADSHKRTPKPTAKAVEGKLNRLKKERKGKLSHLTRKRKEIGILKKDRANAEIIKKELFVFGKFYEHFKELNAELLPLLEDEDKKEDQDDWHMPKCVEHEKFAQATEDWIERTIIHPEEKNDDADEGDDDVQPSDSISEVTSRTSKGRKASSTFSRSSQVSNTSSARLKLEAEREELLACAAFLKKKQDIEMEEARLKARKEQLELEAKIAASGAKIKVYADYEDGQDGMNQYYESGCKYSAGLKDTSHIKDEEEETHLRASPRASMTEQHTSTHFYCPS